MTEKNNSERRSGGPLGGVRIIEFAGIGPVPFAGMLLSDLGADIVRIDRIGTRNDLREAVNRGRTFVEADLKRTRDIEHVLELVTSADAIMEGFRPGVMERLGLGPDTLMKRNQRLVYGRMTGWGQTGPLSMSAGHDLNYIAISGALSAIGTREAPLPPLNLVGDYGGGSLYLVTAMLAGIIEARTSGQGQVVDVAMCDGAASLLSMFSSMQQIGQWVEDRASNVVDGGAHFYNVYECSDGKFISVGAIEPQFYALLIKLIGANDDSAAQNNRGSWQDKRVIFAEIFRKRTQVEWCALLEKTDACFAPVLSMSEAPSHPHYLARNSFVRHNGIVQPAPVPRYSRTRCEIRPSGSAQLKLTDIQAQWRSSAVNS
jgi:alpha-methylacyl-CoA racemase